MVAKIIVGKSLFGLLSYNEKKIKENKAHVLFDNRVCNSVNSDDFSIQNAMLSFNYHLINNNNTKKPFVHISLNPDPKDNLSEEQLEEITKDYLEQLGYANQPYIVFEHYDIERKHLHIVITNVDYNGKKINDSYQKLKSMQICRNLEEKYNLHRVKNEKDKEKVLYLDVLNDKNKSYKEKLNNAILTLTSHYNFKTLGELTAVLSCYGISLKHLKGNKYGEDYNGFVYQLLSKDKKEINTPLKASLLSERCGFKYLTALMEENKESFNRNQYNKLKISIDKALRETKNIPEFIQNLKKSGIDTVIRENSERITGVTYVDHNTKSVLNGSNLGKKYSANAINDYFNMKEELKEPQRREESKDLSAVPVITRENPIQNDKSTFESLLDILDTPDYHAYEDENEMKKLRRKKKKGKSI